MHLSLKFLCYAAVAFSFAVHSLVGLVGKSHAPRGHFLQPYSDLNSTTWVNKLSDEPGTFTQPHDFSGEVRWQDMTSKDGTKSGHDSNKIWYLRDAIELYLQRVPLEKRNGVYWSGGATTTQDFYDIYLFIKEELKGNGIILSHVYTIDDFTAMGLNEDDKNGLWWRTMNRASKAVAASTSGHGIAYVYLNPVNHRTIFSPPSQAPKDEDPAHNNQATNGEIWYYAELPMLMRNLNIKQIVSFWFNKDNKIEKKVEWDAERDKHAHPRTKFDDIAMDASPIVLPPQAGRPPLVKKRNGGMHGGY